MALEKQLKYKVGEQRLLLFAEEMIKEEKREKRREIWGTIPEWATAVIVTYVAYDIYLRDSVNNFIEYIMQYFSK